MSTPFELTGSLSVPPDSGVPAAPIPFGGVGAFESRADVELNIAAAGTISVDFGTIGSPGAKCALIEVDPSPTGDPINCRFNGGGSSGQVEVSPGGALAYYSPVPVAGLTALDIVSTTANKVRVRLFG